MVWYGEPRDCPRDRVHEAGDLELRTQEYHLCDENTGERVEGVVSVEIYDRIAKMDHIHRARLSDLGAEFLHEQISSVFLERRIFLDLEGHSLLFLWKDF